jgi:uncharacterized protein YbjT (DUF2867 family)
MSSFMPFLPVFAGGATKFQPVYVGDLASLVEIISRKDPAVRSVVDGKTVEAGGPDGSNQPNGLDQNFAHLSHFSF